MRVEGGGGLDKLPNAAGIRNGAQEGKLAKRIASLLNKVAKGKFGFKEMAKNRGRKGKVIGPEGNKTSRHANGIIADSGRKLGPKVNIQYVPVPPSPSAGTDSGVGRKNIYGHVPNAFERPAEVDGYSKLNVAPPERENMYQSPAASLRSDDEYGELKLKPKSVEVVRTGNVVAHALSQAAPETRKQGELVKWLSENPAFQKPRGVLNLRGSDLSQVRLDTVVEACKNLEFINVDKGLEGLADNLPGWRAEDGHDGTYTILMRNRV